MLQQNSIQNYNVIIIGAGAAGLMCASKAGERGKSVLVVDHSKKPAEKIRISGGGRCNFTNINTKPENFLSQNPHFCISPLKKFTASDFIKLVEKYNIAYHEKTLGQLFCNGSSQQIINMLLSECEIGKAQIQLQSNVDNISKNDQGFRLVINNNEFSCTSLVIATGGPSIPKMGGSSFGYDIAGKFGIRVIDTRPALVPFTLNEEMLHSFAALSGISLNVITKCNKAQFQEGMLFTHRGLSGPAILQISSYWKNEEIVGINLAPGRNIFLELKNKKILTPKQEVAAVLTDILPKRLAYTLCEYLHINGQIANLPDSKLKLLAEFIQNWQVAPSGTEGYRTAEVTLGGIDTDAISSSSFESKDVKGLYFIGEVIDVTGHLGGHNFQWAWSSGYAAGQFV